MPGLDPVLLAVYSELEGTELVEVTIMMMMIKMMTIMMTTMVMIVTILMMLTPLWTQNLTILLSVTDRPTDPQTHRLIGMRWTHPTRLPCNQETDQPTNQFVNYHTNQPTNRPTNFSNGVAKSQCLCQYTYRQRRKIKGAKPGECLDVI